MKKWWTLLTCCALVPLLTEAWGPHRSADFPETAQVPFDQLHHYPFKKDLDWSVNMTYLIVHPHEEDVDYADKIDVVPGAGGIPSSNKLKLEDPNFGWWSGVRLAASRFLPNNDKWDANLAMTYLYANTEQKSRANPAASQVMFTEWSFSNIGPNLLHANMSWKLNYFIWDLDVGRYYRLFRTFYVHPHIGLRAGLIYVDYQTTYLQQFTGTTEKARFSADQDFWGIGPRVGSDFSWGLRNSWSILGNLSVSLLYGHDKVQQKIDGFTTTLTPLSLHQRAHGTPLRTNLEGAIGLGWERWVKQDTVHLASSFQFEVSEWFSMNSFFHITETATDPLATDIAVGEIERHHGNLGYYGFTVNLTVDF